MERLGNDERLHDLRTLIKRLETANAHERELLARHASRHEIGFAIGERVMLEKLFCRMIDDPTYFNKRRRP